MRFINIQVLNQIQIRMALCVHYSSNIKKSKKKLCSLIVDMYRVSDDKLLNVKGALFVLSNDVEYLIK
jgi:hypothetical protein